MNKNWPESKPDELRLKSFYKKSKGNSNSASRPTSKTNDNSFKRHDN